MLVITIFETQFLRFSLNHSVKNISLYGSPSKYQKPHFVTKLKMP